MCYTGVAPTCYTFEASYDCQLPARTAARAAHRRPLLRRSTVAAGSTGGTAALSLRRHSRGALWQAAAGVLWQAPPDFSGNEALMMKLERR